MTSRMPATVHAIAPSKPTLKLGLKTCGSRDR